MPEQVEIGVEGQLGVVALNRPEAINALNHGMIADITAVLMRWREDGNVRAVLFEGRGPRGFCAGGDVRAVRKLVLDGWHGEAAAFFAAEYRMNHLIASYPKPVIAFTRGVVMGGGIGIAGHADFRFCAMDTSFAMPEAAIGFCADVGVHAILARAPLSRALLFLLSGLPVGAADALALGLADCVIASERMTDVRASLVTAATAADLDMALVALMQTEGIEPGEAELAGLADRLEPALKLPEVEAVVTAIAAEAEVAQHPALQTLAKALASRSPTSLEAIFAGHRAARSDPEVANVLGRDLEVAKLMIARPDFAEGVRAVLIDKDRAPKWQPADFSPNARADIEKALAAGSPIITS
jgi:enoyl-CoA hydratase